MFTKHVIKQLSAYCNGELSPEESRSLRDHLESCERCRREHDQVKLGVQLAQQLTLVQAPADLWDEIETLLDAQAPKRMFQPQVPRFAWGFGWYRIAALTAMVVVAVAIGLIWSSYQPRLPGPPDASGASMEVANVVGNVRIEGGRINKQGILKVGQTLETGESSLAKIQISTIGEVDLDPRSSVRLVQTNESEHRLALNKGRLSAKIKAPPRLFFVNTPSAEAIDLGCAYTLEVDDAGRSFLHVTSGWVELVGNGHESYVPIGAMCESRPGIGPGTPYFDDASEAFVQALEKFDFEGGDEQAFNAVLAECRPRDTFTLWQLLSRVEGNQRVRVLDRMIALVGLPASITREGTLKLDPDTLEAWKDEMDLVWF
jgi:putative zinc finger protein/FecR-like protein